MYFILGFLVGAQLTTSFFDKPDSGEVRVTGTKMSCGFELVPAAGWQIGWHQQYWRSSATCYVNEDGSINEKGLCVRRIPVDTLVVVERGDIAHLRLAHPDELCRVPLPKGYRFCFNKKTGKYIVRNTWDCDDCGNILSYSGDPDKDPDCIGWSSFGWHATVAETSDTCLLKKYVRGFIAHMEKRNYK